MKGLEKLAHFECLHAAFSAPMNGEAALISENLVDYDYFDENGAVYIDKIIREYQVYAVSIFTNPILQEADEIIEGVNITTYLVRYDTETDFSMPKKGTKKTS